MCDSDASLSFLHCLKASVCCGHDMFCVRALKNPPHTHNSDTSEPPSPSKTASHNYPSTAKVCFSFLAGNCCVSLKIHWKLQTKRRKSNCGCSLDSYTHTRRDAHILSIVFPSIIKANSMFFFSPVCVLWWRWSRHPVGEPACLQGDRWV